ncbi:MAG: flagellar FliJ family protein [Verrucomicrobiales bacterium]|nr:flagellar FliJ family protein [Verrucomicrobiales bacterium]
MERYSAALQSRIRAAEAVAAAEQVRARAAEAMTRRLTEGIPAAEAFREQAYYRTLEAKRDAAQNALVAAENAVPPALNAMLQAKNQREAVEECIARQRERHVRDQMVQERKMLDELALRRAGAVRAFAGSD